MILSLELSPNHFLWCFILIGIVGVGQKETLDSCYVLNTLCVLAILRALSLLVLTVSEVPPKLSALFWERKS